MAKIKSFFYFFKGKNLYHLGRYEEALIAFEEAIRFNSNKNIYQYKQKALKQISNSNPTTHKNQQIKYIKNENHSELKYKEVNEQLSKQLDEMQGQFKTLQKQVSDLNSSLKLEKVIKVVKNSRNENLKDKISELQKEVKEFKGMQDQFTKLQGKVEKNEKTAKEQLKRNNSQMEGLQEQMYSLESTNSLTSRQVIKIQGQIEKNEKMTGGNKNELNENFSKQVKSILEDNSLEVLSNNISKHFLLLEDTNGRYKCIKYNRKYRYAYGRNILM